MKPASVIITRFPYSSQLGGEEIHTFMITEYLQKKEVNVEFWTSCPVLLEYAKKNKIIYYKKWLYKPPVSALSLIGFTLLSPLLFMITFWWMLKIKFTRKNPTIYALSFTEKLLLAPWAMLFRIQLIGVEHARIGRWFTHNPWKYWYKLWARSKWFKIVTVSKIMKQDIGIANVEVIVNAIDTKLFSRLYNVSDLPEQVRKFLQESKINIGYVGRLTEDKGMKLLIKLKKSNPDLGVITIGSGSYKKRLLNQGIRNYSFMTKKEVACFLQNIDLFVLPATQTDPFGLVVLEAIAAKCPTVITNKVGASDYLIPNQEVVICKQSEFVGTVLNVLNNKELRKVLKESSESTMERFKVEAMLDSYYKLLVS